MEKYNTSRDEGQLANWLRAGLAGDERQYRAFLGSIAPILRGVIKAKAGGLSPEEQEDILQDVLLAIHNKRATWRQDHPVKPWVYAIARYKIIDVFRARGRAQFVDVDDFQDILPAPEADLATPMDAHALIGQLSKKQGLVVKMIAVDGLSIQDTARELGMKETAVRVNFHRGLERLRQIHNEEQS